MSMPNPMLRLASSATLASTTAAWPTGSTFLSASSSNSVTRHDHHWCLPPHVHWSLMSPADNTSALPAVISWLFRATSAPHLAVGPSLLRALWHGMHCLTTSKIRRWDTTHFNVSSRRFCFRSTSFPSALEVFHDYMLYKFTIDIDIDIHRRGPWRPSAGSWVVSL